MNYNKFIVTMSKFIARKERLVEDFTSTMSDLDSKSCDKIENSLYEIIKKTRGLIYADQYRQKTDKHTNSVLPNVPIPVRIQTSYNPTWMKSDSIIKCTEKFLNIFSFLYVQNN